MGEQREGKKEGIMEGRNKGRKEGTSPHNGHLAENTHSMNTMESQPINDTVRTQATYSISPDCDREKER